MRTLLAVLAALSGCYAPQLQPCAVHCTNDTPCPDDMTCGPDAHCHAPGDTMVCPTDYIVEVAKAGTGTGVVTNGAEIVCGSQCTTTVNDGGSVRLTAASDNGSRFAGFSGPCSGTGPCLFRADGDKTVGAVFNLQKPLTVVFGGPGTGLVISEPNGIDCTADCAALFDLNSTVTLTATPDAIFVGWGGACTGTGTCVVSIDGSVKVTARFE